MTEQEKDLRRAISLNVNDFGPRQVYADWCDEYGMSERAEFIRNDLQTHEIKTKRMPHVYMSLASQPLQKDDVDIEAELQVSATSLDLKNWRLRYEAWTKEFMEIVVPNQPYKTIRLQDFRLVRANTGRLNNDWEQDYIAPVTAEQYNRDVPLHRRFVPSDERVLEFRSTDPIVYDVNLVNTAVLIEVGDNTFGPGIIRAMHVDVAGGGMDYHVEMRMPNPAYAYNQSYDTKWGLPYKLNVPLKQFIEIVPHMTWPITQVSFTDLQTESSRQNQQRAIYDASGHLVGHTVAEESRYGSRYVNMRFSSLSPGEMIPRWLLLNGGQMVHANTIGDLAVQHLRDFHNLPPLSKGK